MSALVCVYGWWNCLAIWCTVNPYAALPAGLRTLNNYLYEELQRMLQSRNLNRRKEDFTVQIDLLAVLNGQ